LERVPTWTYEETNRIGAETSNVQAVMDGDIDMFIQAKLRGKTASEG
jgi:protein subunit release factor B